jgi:hypothetical protein
VGEDSGVRGEGDVLLGVGVAVWVGDVVGVAGEGEFELCVRWVVLLPLTFGAVLSLCGERSSIHSSGLEKLLSVEGGEEVGSLPLFLLFSLGAGSSSILSSRLAKVLGAGVGGEEEVCGAFLLVFSCPFLYIREGLL